MTWRRRTWLTAVPKLVVIALSATVIACSPISSASAMLPARSVQATTTGPAPIVDEPSLAGAYLTAYAKGDLTAADQVASPLNQIEWSRRGFSLAVRQTLLPEARGPGAPWMTFHYVGGTWDGAGFGHLLYLGEPVDGSQSTYPSAWRVDLDPSGRVIWAELVYLFSESTPLAPVNGTAVSSEALPPALVNQNARLVAGVRSTAGPERYYVLAVPARSAASAAAGPTSIKFVGIDSDGQIRPGAWSYGVDSSAAPYGQTTPPHSVALEPALAQLLASYLVDCES
jgi:hypothetical protein